MASPEEVGLKNVPCLTEAATLLLRAIADGKDVFEFGSGGSTLWFVEFANKLRSVEDDKAWYEAVTHALGEIGHDDAKVTLTTTDKLPAAIDRAGKWDVVFVDCLAQKARQQAIIHGASHVKPGGWLVADDYTFPMTRAEIDRLGAAGWDVAIVGGVKVHPIRKIVVKTATAFCHKVK